MKLRGLFLVKIFFCQKRKRIREECIPNIGYTGGIEQLETFINERVSNFGVGRNDPNKSAISNLSPWFHYGQISPQRALLIIAKLRPKFKEACDSFIEEAFVRRELSENYCYYQENCKFRRKILSLFNIYFKMII